MHDGRGCVTCIQPPGLIKTSCMYQTASMVDSINPSGMHAVILPLLRLCAVMLNRVAAGEGDWDSVRAPLAQKYAEAGLSSVADFVLAGQKA